MLLVEPQQYAVFSSGIVDRYALSVAARPDHNYRLVSYPYISKDSDDGDRTGFLHLNLNVREFIRAGHGANTLSTSLSLDPEDKDACTLVVPGFHRHIHQWHQIRIARGDDYLDRPPIAINNIAPKIALTGVIPSLLLPAQPLAFVSLAQRSFMVLQSPPHAVVESYSHGISAFKTIISPSRSLALLTGNKSPPVTGI
jgi:hypothetical protein